jgi:hypothetical protein
MNMNRKIWVFMGVVLSCLLPGGGSALAKSAELELYPFVKHLAVESDVENAIGSFVLDSEIFEKVAADYSDMRVVDDYGIEIPFLIRSKTGRSNLASNRVHDINVSNDGNLTIIEFSAQREPVTEIKVFASSGNFSRSIKIEGRDSDTFRERLRGTYSYVETGDLNRDKRSMHLRQPLRCSGWRITIDNKDSPALEITGVTLVEKVYEGVFVTEDPGAYRLFYGGAQAHKPRYDVGAILAVGRNQFAVYRISEELINGEYNKSAWHLRIGGRVVLTVAILLMVAALGWGIVVASKQV